MESELTTPKLWLDELKAYLRAHENDIALGINDFGSLEWVFMSIFLENPKVK